MGIAMLKRLVLASFLLAAAYSANALEYTDVYYDPTESGWGVFLVQSNTTQFLAFFIYGADGKPTWYTAQLTDDGTGKYTGPLFVTTGTYFPLPWQGNTLVAAGTASFQPSDVYHATLTYTVNGVGTVTKPIQRQTLAPYVLAGTYSGSAAGSITGCINPANNITPLRARFNLTVTQVGDTSATLTFTFVDNTYSGNACTLSGPLTHIGRLYQMVNAQFACTGPGPAFAPFTTTATVESFHPSGQGVEGHWAATGNGCTEIVHFASVLN